MKVLGALVLVFGLLGLVVVLVAGYLQSTKRWWRCAWCKSYFDEEENVVDCLPRGCGPVTSDGMCPRCAKKEMARLEFLFSCQGPKRGLIDYEPAGDTTVWLAPRETRNNGKETHNPRTSTE